MRKIIINADDFGRTRTVDDAIIDCIKNGEITSTTIMANGEDFDNVLNAYKSYPDISYGVHLVLDEYESLTKSPILLKNGLIDKNGFFVKGAYQKVKYTKELKNAIFDEWSAQIDKIQGCGISLSHIDSHHHVHSFNLSTAMITKRIVDKYNIFKVRQNMYLPLFKRRHYRVRGFVFPNDNNSPTNQSVRNVFCKLKSYILVANTVFVDFLVHQYLRRTFCSTDFLMAARVFIKHGPLIEHELGFESIELMCHPGHPSYIEETESLHLLLRINNKISYKEL